MRKYGLHLGVVAGVLLAATLGAVAGAHWAGRASRRASQAGDGATVGEETLAAGQQGPRRVSPPRFVATGADPAAPVAAAPHRSRHHRPLAAAAPDGVRAPGDSGSEAGREGPQPSPTAIARARDVRAALEAAAAAHPGVRVRYADCSAGACVASVEAGEAAAIDKLIEDKQRLPPGFMVRAHERLTAFNGRLWEAEFVEIRN